MKTAILTDSGSNLSQEFINKHDNLFVVPLMILVDGKEYRDGLEISPDQVYQQLDDHEVKTSLPLLSDFEETVKEIKGKGFTHVLVINISSGLSGTYNSFRLAIGEEEDLDFIQYDTKTLGGGQGILVEEALELVKENLSFSEIIKKLDKLRYEDSIAFYTINTLKYLRDGGRIGKVEGTIGNILHIKPVVTVNDEGVYVTLSKAFGLKRSLLKMKSILKEKYNEDKIDLIIHYGNNKELAIELSEKIKSSLNIRHIRLQPLTPVLGVHTGPDIIAYVAKRV
jgi:DegV family protein with EDD domain